MAYLCIHDNSTKTVIFSVIYAYVCLMAICFIAYKNTRKYSDDINPHAAIENYSFLTLHTIVKKVHSLSWFSFAKKSLTIIYSSIFFGMYLLRHRTFNICDVITTVQLSKTSSGDKKKTQSHTSTAYENMFEIHWYMYSN